MSNERMLDHSKYKLWIDPNEVTEYKNNAKIHTDRQIKNICTSIRRFGWQQDTVLTTDNVLVIGHGRRLAALKLGCEMPYHVIDKTADELTDEDIRELRIADNQTNAETGLDFDMLNIEIEDLDFEGFDFDFGIDTEEQDEEPIEIVEDEPPTETETRCKAGGLWQLGEHRLICGDSTDVAVVDRLMDGVKADLVVTDPPYNMGYEGAGNTKDRSSKRILNDKMPEDKFEQFLGDVYTAYFLSMKDGASIYVFYKELGSGVFMRKMRDSGLTYKQELIWVKSQLVLGGSKYQSMYEPCLMGCKGKSIKKVERKTKSKKRN